MPYFRPQDQKTKSNSWADEAHAVLVLAIQTIDDHFVVGTEATRELRQRLDLILNSDHWKKKRSKEANERLNWYATTGGHES